MKTPLRLLTALALGAPICAHALEFRAQAEGAWVENLSRTSFTPTTQDASVFTASGTALAMRQLSPDLTGFATFEAGFERVPDFAALDRVHAGLRATLRRKFGLGPQAPVLDASLGIARHDFRESGRTGWRSEGSVRLAQRFGEAWRVAATAAWDSHSAQHAPFTLHSRRLSLEATWDATARLSFSAGGATQRGQIVANAAWSIWGQAISGGLGNVVQDYYTRIPWETTDTFGAGWVAYRVEATVDLWWGEASFQLAEATRLILRRETAKVVNRIDVRYDTEILSLGVAHRF